MEHLKRFFRLWPALAFALAVASAAWAQESAAAGDQAELTRHVLVLIANVTPVVIFLAKKLLPVELSPYIAPAIGAIATVLINWFTGAGVDPVLGTLAGSAGVGVREALDQGKKALGVRQE